MHPTLKVLEHLMYILECASIDHAAEARGELFDLCEKLESDPAYACEEREQLILKLREALASYIILEVKHGSTLLGRVSHDLWRQYGDKATSNFYAVPFLEDREELATGEEPIPRPAEAPPEIYPYLVVRIYSAVYQRERIEIIQGEAAVEIRAKGTFVRHPQPFNSQGELSDGCRRLLLDGVLEAVQRTHFRMCVVWNSSSCSFVERDGIITESSDPPSGGINLPKLAFHEPPRRIEPQ